MFAKCWFVKVSSVLGRVGIFADLNEDSVTLVANYVHNVAKGMGLTPLILYNICLR